MSRITQKLRDYLGTHGQIPPKAFPGPVFIIGCMRSGTTYLVDKITEHPQFLKMGSELNEIWTEIGGADCQKKCTYKNGSSASHEFSNNMTYYFQRFINESRSLKRHLMRLKNRIQQKSGTVFYDWENIRVVNKSTHLTNKIKYINTLFPNLSLIYLVRSIFAHSSSMKLHFDQMHSIEDLVFISPENDKDCWSIVSQKEVPDSLNKKRMYPGNFSIIPQMWINLNYQALKDLETMPKDKYRIVRYEELVNNQSAIIMKLYRFLGSGESNTVKVEAIAKSRGRKHNTTSSGDPLLKWKTLLSEEEKEQIQKVIDTNKVKYNYIIENLEARKMSTH